jgi:cobalt-zinc-cadmium efflux system protein
MERDERRLVAALGLLTAYLIGEVIAAVVAGSLALLADAGHLLVDALSLVAVLVAARLARRPATGAWTFGLARAEVLSAAVNGGTLVVVAVLVTIEAVHRLVHPSAVSGPTVIVVAAIGLAVNLVVSTMLHRSERQSMNLAGAISHVLTDAYAFAATVIAGLVVTTAHWRQADPVASLVVVVLLLRAAHDLLRQSGRVLLEAAPSEVDLALVREHLLGSEQVIGVHDLHVWTVTSGLPALSVHVVVDEQCFAAGRAPRLLDQLQGCLAGHFDVEHSTFQLESVAHADHEVGAHA